VITNRPGRRGCGGRPKISEREEREEHILQVAGEIFLLFGFDGTSMDAVAEAARISKRTLYARYADKTALFNAIARDQINRWLVPIDEFQSEQGELRDTLLALARYLTTFALTPRSVSINRIIISEAQRRPEFGRLANEVGRRPAIHAIATILRRHSAELRPIDPNMAAEQFMSLAIDNNQRLAFLGIRASPEQIELWVRTSVELFLAGVTRQNLVQEERMGQPDRAET
jgi:TetR/AcrR family transcriptional regulator, mexJK operon transcriptional repressor